jgi:hypothetical protein
MQLQATSLHKDTYKVKNWKQYNASLCQRGSISLWIEDSVLRAWREVDVNQKVVGEKTYPDSVILCCLVIGIQYHQKLRQMTGFVKSLLQLLGKGDYAVPDYSTLCRRQACLPVEVSKRWQQGEQLAVAIDSTGLQVYGEGEWKVRKHGVSKRRTWRKLHIGIDLLTQEIISVALTTNSEDDAAVATRMVKGKTEKMKSFTGDGAYDDFAFRQGLGTQVQQIIPPPKDAIVHQATKRKPLKAFLQWRNEAIVFMETRGRKEWKIQQGYHQRSLNEVAMFRYKTSFTHQLNARKIDNQQTEAKIKCKILNTYWQAGMPLADKAA